MTSSDLKRRPAPGEVIAVVKRILAENGRDYFGLYALAALCLVAVAASVDRGKMAGQGSKSFLPP